MSLVRYIILIIFVAFGTPSFGQVLTPVKWTTEIKHVTEDEYNLIFTAKIQKGWNVYSQFTSDDGPVPTSLNFESMEGAEIMGKAKEQGYKKEGHDPLFETNVIKFLDKEPFVITQRVKVNDSSKPIEGYLTFMTCDSKRCLPPEDIDFSFQISEDMDANVKDPQPEKKNTQPNIKFNYSGIDAEEITMGQEEPSKAGILDPVTWTIDLIEDGEEAKLVFKAVMEKGWNVYSQHTSDDGPVPTEIVYEFKEGVALAENNTESGYRKEGPDPLFDGVNVIKFLDKEPFIITQNLKILDKDKPLSGYLTYMTCNDKTCLPPQDVEFTFLDSSDESGTSLAKIEGDIIDQFIPSLNEGYKNPVADCGTTSKAGSGLLWTFLFGFIGGLFALLTPCVFPMIPITVSFFTKDTNRKGWVNGLIYGLSIIAIYVAIGLVITSIFGPEALNRLSTNWIANTLFFIIFIFFAFSFFGFYEITLPSSWSTKSDQMADKGGLLGIFFMAFTLALVSFSCTGPIIGTALVEASSSGSYVGPFLVMFGFSLALALPFGLFAAFPAWLNSLPRSGSWMNSVKVVLGFLELALAFKFLSVADMTNHWGLLKYELFMAIWILVFLGMTIYLFGFIKFPHDSPIKKLSNTRKVFALLALAFTGYLATGFFYNDTTKSYNALSLMSGLAPPSHYNFFLDEPEIDEDIKSKYMSYTKCANNINCFKDYYDGLAYAKETNKAILLDFTGYGCVNCRKTEEHIWVDDQIRSTLNDELVLISLYVDDDKKLDKVLLSKSRNKKLRDVGDMWADFQIVNFEQNSQPLYILLSPDEEVLTTPRGYEEGIEGYRGFLECGLSSFKQKDLGVN
jgi:thiol:disulfide interchange protein DsbD